MLPRRLASLRQLDVDRALFGADAHKHNPLPPLVEDELRVVEGQLGVGLPESYRRYLSQVSSGGAGPGYGLPWPGALLVDSDDAVSFYESAAARMFLSAEEKAWAASEFAPLSESDVQVRLQGFPAEARERLVADARWVRSFEGRRNRYIDHCCAPYLEPAGNTESAFPFRERHTAAPEIDAIDWNALPDDERSSTFVRLREKYGFDRAWDGTIRLGDYGSGVVALLVVAGPERGAVWMFDTENLVLEPFFPQWADWHHYPPPPPPWDFEAWFSHWLDGAERQLQRGIKPMGRSLWG